jgi:hypothetical protein
MTEKQLREWLKRHRPDLGLDEINGRKGFYRKDKGQAASFQACGKTWADVARRLGAR